MTNSSDYRAHHPARGIATAGALALLAACAHHPKGTPAVSPPPPPQMPVAAATSQGTFQAVPGRSPRQRYAAAVGLLEQGSAAQARAELAALLQDRPGDRHARQLLREIDTDPHEIYGNDSFSYTVRTGDTLVSLAHRYLRDADNFYGLARFNGLTFPVELQPGQTIMIPGRARSAQRTPAPSRRPPAVTSQPAPPTPADTARAAPSAADRVRAQRLRQQGLEQMSAGSIDRAVQLLAQAAVLDPKNGAIAGELARARRIQATVHGH